MFGLIGFFLQMAVIWANPFSDEYLLQYFRESVPYMNVKMKGAFTVYVFF